MTKKPKPDKVPKPHDGFKGWLDYVLSCAERDYMIFTSEIRHARTELRTLRRRKK